MGMEGQEVPIQIVKKNTDSDQNSKVSEMVQTTRAVALERIHKAENLADYLQWHHAAANTFSDPSIRGLWDGEESTTEFADSMIAMAEKEDAKEVARKEAAIVEELKTRLDTMPYSQEMCKIVLKKIGEHDGYRLLIELPYGTHVDDPLDGVDKDKPINPLAPTIYYNPGTPCSNQACDALFATHGEEAFQIPYLPYGQLNSVLKTAPDGVAHFQFDDPGGERVVQHKEAYALFGALGGFVNETNRVRVSDYWNRTNSPANG